MPTIDLGSVVGPQGEQGNTGPQGEQGIAGPSLISASTQTTLTAVLAGDGSTVGVRAVDSTPTANSTNLVSSGGVYTKIATDVANAYQRTVNPNLLDNWYFANAVNQRGASSYPNDGYCIDRWYRKWFTALSVSTSGILMTAGSGSVGQLVQEIEILNNSTIRTGKTITFSVLVTSVTGTGGRIAIALGSSISSNTSNLVSKAFSTTGLYEISVTLPESQGAKINFIIQAELSSTINVLAAKVELESTQTLCHNNGTNENPVWVLNEIPGFGTELAKCQRYLLVLTAQNNLPVVGNGVAISGTQGIISVPTPVTMRKATPTVSATGTIVLNHGATFGSAAPAISSISGPSLSENVVSFGANVASGLTNGEVCGLQLRDSSAIITISCEL